MEFQKRIFYSSSRGEGRGEINSISPISTVEIIAKKLNLPVERPIRNSSFPSVAQGMAERGKTSAPPFSIEDVYGFYVANLATSRQESSAQNTIIGIEIARTEWGSPLTLEELYEAGNHGLDAFTPKLVEKIQALLGDNAPPTHWKEIKELIDSKKAKDLELSQKDILGALISIQSPQDQSLDFLRAIKIVHSTAESSITLIQIHKGVLEIATAGPRSPKVLAINRAMYLEQNQQTQAEIQIALSKHPEATHVFGICGINHIESFGPPIGKFEEIPPKK